MPRGKKGASATETKVSIATQTENVDNNSEIARLQEQIKRLQLQNETLLKERKNEASISLNSPTKNLRSARSMQILNEIVESKLRSPMKGCTCKRNCSSKQCGCVKKNLKCGGSCKCSSDCQNQESDDKEMNKENIQNIAQEGINDKTISEVSPTKEEQVNHSSIEENQQNNKLLNENFDPMKPKHQLIRTPPRSSTESTSRNSSPESVNTTAELITESSSRKVEDMPEVLKQENVDLSKLNIELVNCAKCNRKFYPWRVEAHEAACRKV